MSLEIFSWNVNGIRAAQKKGFEDWFRNVGPEILCLQEIKAHPEQLEPQLAQPKGYQAYWHPAEKKGYSGVATFTKKIPEKVELLNVPLFDAEGRVQILHFKNFSLFNCYFPNSQEGGRRLDYKLAFCKALLKKANALVKAGRNVVICGDYNIAHKAIDLKNPKNNEKNPGYLPEERAWMDAFVKAGYLDTFRMFNQEPGYYSWWSYRFQARQRDIGWRIDYHCVNRDFESRVQDAEILKDVLGSDHCPVTVTLRE